MLSHRQMKLNGFRDFFHNKERQKSHKRLLKEDSELSYLTHVDTEAVATEQGCHVGKAALSATGWAAGQILCSELLRYKGNYLT